MNNLENVKYTTGFLVATANFAVRCGYAIRPDGVHLFATTQVGDQAPQVWRSFVSPRANACSQAAGLVDDIYDYIHRFRAPLRPVEDLDLEDFLEHLYCNLYGELH